MEIKIIVQFYGRLSRPLFEPAAASDKGQKVTPRLPCAQKNAIQTLPRNEVQTASPCSHPPWHSYTNKPYNAIIDANYKYLEESIKRFCLRWSDSFIDNVSMRLAITFPVPSERSQFRSIFKAFHPLSHQSSLMYERRHH